MSAEFVIKTQHTEPQVELELINWAPGLIRVLARMGDDVQCLGCFENGEFVRFELSERASEKMGLCTQNKRIKVQ